MLERGMKVEVSFEHEAQIRRVGGRLYDGETLICLVRGDQKNWRERQHDAEIIVTALNRYLNDEGANRHERK